MKHQSHERVKIMPWIDVLPDVATTDLQARRDIIQELALQAAEATHKALIFTRQAENLRTRAHLAAYALEGEAKNRFTADDVEQAKILVFAR
ncbi:protein kleA [Escherichia coli]|nr:protein kleA [Escherichia coli]